MKQHIELLAPAKNLECGIAAIDHGADAVYIGAQRFGARVAAGNSVEDIAALCRYAHPFGAKVYVTVNTIVYDDELEATTQLLEDLKAANVDAILVQDMALLPTSTLLPLHASTQTDNRTPEKVALLRSLGFRRVVLARELSLEEIRAIHEAVPDVELEVFVHGALCVSYSGQCYASQHCYGRSANRGACAQFCRLPFDLVDARGQMIERERHLLSLKDLCQIDRLEDLMEAGAVSFKIEGRLKDVAYVKNVTAAYSQRLNQIIGRHPDKYQRASRGRCTYSFEPNLKKTFNRGFTSYFLDAHWQDMVLENRSREVFSPDTPKALGEYVGRVKEIRRDSFNVAGTACFSNGDGLCFFERTAEAGARTLTGFRVNRVEGNRLYPLKMPTGLKPGTPLYRNNDMAFERLMAGQTAERKLPVTMTLEAVDDGFELRLYAVQDAESQLIASERFALLHQTAQKPQRENIVRQLTKLGGTPYQCDDVQLLPADFPYFIPSSMLAEWRRAVVAACGEVKPDAEAVEEPMTDAPLPTTDYDRKYPYLFNAANSRARDFYATQGIGDATAFETSPGGGENVLMQCRHCLRFSLGYCVKHGGEKPYWQEPLHLVSGDGRRFRLEFDCKNCQMNVISCK